MIYCIFCWEQSKTQFCSNSCRIFYNKIGKSLKFLDYKFPWAKTIKEKVFCKKNNIKDRPICKFCENKPIKFLKTTTKYSNTCSISCWNYYSQCNKSLNFIMKKFPWLDTIWEWIYCYKNKINKKPICKICSKKLKYSSKSWKYNKYCSMKCKNLFEKKKSELQKNKKIETIYKCKYCEEKVKWKESCSIKCSLYFNKTKKKRKELQKKYIWAKSDKELFYCYKNKIKRKPICKFCEKNYIDFNFNQNKYNDCCSSKCFSRYNGLLKNSLREVNNYINFTPISDKELSYCFLHNIKDRPFCECWKEKIYSFHKYRCKGCTTSKSENDIIKYIKKIYKGKVIQGNRTILNWKEIDIYIPEKNLAIEYNWIYYHSYNPKYSSKIYKNYHLDKTIWCEKNNIELLHINEDEWEDKSFQKIWKKHIKWKLGLIKKEDIKDKSYFIDKKWIIDRRFDSILNYFNKKIIIYPPKYKIVIKERLLWDSGYFKIK